MTRDRALARIDELDRQIAETDPQSSKWLALVGTRARLAAEVRDGGPQPQRGGVMQSEGAVQPGGLESELAHFTGSQEFYQHTMSRSVVFTEGMRYLAEKAGAFWLIDAIASHLVTSERIRHEVALQGGLATLFWKLEKLEGGTWRLTCRTDGYPYGTEIARQEIEYSDFPLDEIKIWTGFDMVRWTIYLPSEH